MKKKKWLFLAIVIVFVLFILIQWNKSDKVVVENKSIKKHEKVYNHTFPKKVSKNDYFKGKFISNDVASIYPRRDALVRDILVDIWDEVIAWDTLAILFNPWVGWEWQSKINIKNTIVSTKNNLINNLELVKEAKIAELDQKILEKEIILRETINNFDSKISQIGDIDTIWSEYQVQLKSLENLQKNLENAIISKEELLLESNNNIIQKERLLNLKIDEIFNKLIPIFYIWNESDINYENINIYDFSEYFSVKDTILRNKIIISLTKFNNNYSILDLENKFEEIIVINNLLVLALKNTIVSTNITEKDISNYISDINIYNTSLISQKEILDDSKNMYSILKSQQKEKIENIETKIIKSENEISLLWSKSNSTQSEKSLSVEKLKASIETLNKSRELLIAMEDKWITVLENEIAIAKADLSKEYIASGDYKIVSPFSWIISKRWIDIWEKISSNLESFRISWVETTLSRITKKEVKFYVPENIKDDLEIWKEIIFSVWDNENKSFTWTIYRISPEIDEKNFSITVQAKVDENILLPNKSTIRVRLETFELLFKVPSSSIYNKEERKIVYYKKDNWKLWIRDINIISDDWEYTLVTWKIDENLKVVTTAIFVK